MKISTGSSLLLLVFLGYSLIVFGQQDSANMSDLPDQHRELESEKLFLHTDKEFYLAGEVVWFKVYCVDVSFHKPMNISKLAYVEILDKDSRAVLQAKISLEAASGNGSFYLPASIASGVYRLRAYTHWMKNFDVDYFFAKSITIVNSGRILDSLPVKDKSFEIVFFPEGGNLVEGLESKVAFKVTDGFGTGVNCKGVVVNQRSDTMATFQSLRFGIGHFILKPTAGDNYKAFISVGDTTVQAQLPGVRVQGIVMC